MPTPNCSESDRLKDELVQNVSHELRTPLTFIKGYIELLSGGDLGQMNERQQDCLKIVAEKTNLVTRLVSDIVFLQQIENESLQLADIDLGQMMRRVVQVTRVRRSESGYTAGCLPPDLPLVRADQDRILQVFDNLIGNAIKFSPNGGVITLQAQEVGDTVRVGWCRIPASASQRTVWSASLSDSTRWMAPPRASSAEQD